MSITAQPLPQHPPAFPPPCTVATRTTDTGALHRDMDTVAAQLHALEVTAVRLAEERDRYRAERDQARRDRQDAVDTAGRLLARLRRADRDLAAVQADNEALRAELRHATAAAEESVTALADAVREIDGLRQVAGTASKPWWHPVRGRGRTGL